MYVITNILYIDHDHVTYSNVTKTNVEIPGSMFHEIPVQIKFSFSTLKPKIELEFFKLSKARVKHIRKSFFDFISSIFNLVSEHKHIYFLNNLFIATD